MKRALLMTCGAALVVAGCSLMGISGWILATFGTNGVASTSLASITSAPTSLAIVIDIDSARVRTPLLPVDGDISLRLDSSDGEPISAGSAPKDKVDMFLGASEFDAAYRENGMWTLVHVPGDAVAVANQAVPTWLITDAVVSVPINEGDTVVIQQADGTTGVSVNASLQYSAPQAPQAAVALVIGGGAMALSGITLLLSAIWLMKGRQHERLP